jgi:phosphoribosylformylglycinamidine cyclo-ligase
MTNPSKYEARGVSSDKKEVHEAIKNLDKGLFPNAFCKILPDLAGNDNDFCNVMHADTAGTKTSLAYLYYKETGSKAIWKGIAQDAIVMNIDDMACIGCTDNIILSSTIGRNKNLIPGDVIQAIIEGTSNFIQMMNNLGIQIHLAGGETADVGDIVRTVDVGITAFARLKKENLIINDIQAGNVIVGLASSGKANYETDYNSGISSNGLTLARHDTLTHQYADQYPESFDPSIPKNLVYSGNLKLTDSIYTSYGNKTIGELLLSPTRTYLPFLNALPMDLVKSIKGIIHCTGGGQTKVLKFIKNKKVIKNNLLEIPPIFKIIQENSNTEWLEMYKVFNMGHRLEIYTNQSSATKIIEIANKFNIEAKVIGHVVEQPGESVLIQSPFGEFIYD